MICVALCVWVRRAEREGKGWEGLVLWCVG